MDTKQDPEDLELFRDSLARTLLDASVDVEMYKELAEMADWGLVIVARAESGEWNFQITDKGVSFLLMGGETWLPK